MFTRGRMYLDLRLEQLRLLRHLYFRVATPHDLLGVTALGSQTYQVLTQDSLGVYSRRDEVSQKLYHHL